MPNLPASIVDFEVKKSYLTNFSSLFTTKQYWKFSKTVGIYLSSSNFPYKALSISLSFPEPTSPTMTRNRIKILSLTFKFDYTNLPILIGSFLLPMTDNQDILWLPLHSCILYSMLSFLISMAFIDLPYFLEFTIVLIMNQLSNFEFTNTFLD